MLTNQDLAIVQARANGATLQEIATQQGFHEATACRKLQEPDLREHLERIQRQAIEQSAQDTSGNITYLIKSYKRNNCKTPKAAQEKTHGWDATKRMAEAIGILPAHAPSSVVVNIMSQTNIQAAQELSDVARFLAHKWQEDVIEVEPEGAESVP